MERGDVFLRVVVLGGVVVVMTSIALTGEGQTNTFASDLLSASNVTHGGLFDTSSLRHHLPFHFWTTLTLSTIKLTSTTCSHTIPASTPTHPS